MFQISIGVELNRFKVYSVARLLFTRIIYGKI